ncbi:ATP-binding protein [Granulicella paludicola]|uniref:ATP-binding protein n=1 Tax=Granulicella paludicola TaxID=474951 RepID=UPI0021E09CE8|nr:ATP-binding protein [Granulicella paludicola]
MDPVHNPYAPGAGYPPPELAGRDKLREEARISLARLRAKRAAKSLILVGLRGVGKTVLLDQLRADAEAEGICTVRSETPENRSLPALLAPQLRLALLHLNRTEAAREAVLKGLRALAGFARALKIKYGDLEVGLDAEPEAGLADNGDLEIDLTTLLEQTGRAAQSAGTAVVLFIDELQYVKQEQFAALIAALHRCAQAKLPVTIIGAGLPQLRALAGEAKSYAERLFDFATIGPLSITPGPNGEMPDAERALRKPAEDAGVQITAEAVAEILRQTRGYPYFLQEWGKSSWDVAKTSPITEADVRQASIEAVAALDESFFRVRFDRLTPKEKRYLRAMSELGEGPHRSGDIAAVLGKAANSFGTIRQELIDKGMIWSPQHGETAFTVPLFDQFMKRILPGEGWRND